ncbi:hypothetical protein HNQ03_000720 [Chryseobacterium sp. 16F]|uniref:Uncharacterized protein n=1 Tax=Frigoriflavimonas asaccharolytica TaxID=2735899 RepID=A0A8J8K756_9FLAO|nr:hypothetical protein [Frigoriflavimonas asaccharolytica]
MCKKQNPEKIRGFSVVKFEILLLNLSQPDLSGNPFLTKKDWERKAD